MNNVLAADLKNQRYLTEKEVAALTGRAVQTLRNDRHKRRGFPYVKFGSSIRYLLSDVLKVMENHRIDPEAGWRREVNL